MTISHTVRNLNAQMKVEKFPQLFFFMYDGLFSNRKSDIYKCDERDVLIRNCVEKMENMDSQRVASTFLGFLQR